MLGVVNEVTPVPPDNTVPPVAAAYQSMVSPVPGVALKATVPEPQREPGVPVGADGTALTVAVTAVLDAAKQPEVEFLA